LICGISPITLNQSIRKRLLKVAISCNKMLRTKAEGLNLEYNTFRVKFFSGELNITLTTNEQSLVNIMLSEVVPQLMAHYCRLAKRFARRYRYLNCLFDVQEEAINGLLKGIYGYTDPTKSKCSTFVSCSIKNHIIDCQRAHQNIASRRIQELLQTLEDYRSGLPEPITFDEACVRHNVTQNDYRKLTRARCKVISRSQLSRDDDDINEGVYEDNHKFNPDWQKAVDSADLSPVEKQVLEAVMTSSFGNDWGLKSRIARDIMNPKTGKPVTSQTAHDIMVRIHEKIQRAYHNMNIEREAG